MSQSRQEHHAAMRQMMKEMQKQHKQFDLGTNANREALASAIPAGLKLPATVAPAALTSEAKLAANKANAQLSTGPVTVAGKTASSQNNFKHGLYSKQLIMKGENSADLDALKADLRAEHQPANTTEDLLVNEMAEQYWRLKRARRIEAGIFSADSLVIPHMNAVQRLMSSAERGFHKALKTLRELQKQRGFVPQKQEPAVGFVPQKQKTAPGPLPNVLAPASMKHSASGGFESQKQVATSPIDELKALEAEFEAIEKLLTAA